jgi:hypothetical protein
MDQHNYVPAPINHRRGPKPRLSDQRRIGVWFVGAKRNSPSLNWFQDQLLQAQSNSARYRVDLRLLFSNTADDLPAGIAQEKLDGLIIQGMEPSPACLAKLRSLPNVWFMTRRSSTYPGDFVEPNNEENGRLAADHLLAKGHKIVAVISPDPEYSAVHRRVKAFLARATEIGLTPHSLLGKSNPGVSYLEIAPTHNESATLVSALLKTTPRATGLYIPVDHFCGSFFSARPASNQNAISTLSSATTTPSFTKTSTINPRSSILTSPPSSAKSLITCSGESKIPSPPVVSVSPFHLLSYRLAPTAKPSANSLFLTIFC